MATFCRNAAPSSKGRVLLDVQTVADEGSMLLRIVRGSTTGTERRTAEDTCRCCILIYRQV